MSVLELIDNTVTRIKDNEVKRLLRQKERAFIEAAGVLNTSSEVAAANSEAIQTLLTTQEPVLRDSVERQMNSALVALIEDAFRQEGKSGLW